MASLTLHKAYQQNQSQWILIGQYCFPSLLLVFFTPYCQFPHLYKVRQNQLIQHSELHQEKQSTKKKKKEFFSSAKLVFSWEAATKDYLVQNILSWALLLSLYTTTYIYSVSYGCSQIPFGIFKTLQVSVLFESRYSIYTQQWLQVFATCLLFTAFIQSGAVLCQALTPLPLCSCCQDQH